MPSRAWQASTGGGLLCNTLGSCALAAALVASANAQAQRLEPSSGGSPSASDKAVAESLFREGRALLAAGRTDEACSKLQGSHRSDPKTGTLVNLAACHELQGKTASAWAEFSEAAAQATNARRSAVAQLARSRAAALESKLSRLTLRLADPSSDVAVQIDGRPIVHEALGAPLPLDPGTHTIEARRGGATWSASSTLEPGPSSVELTIPRLDPSAPTTAPPAVASAPPLAPTARGPAHTPARGRRVAAYGALGVGAAGVAVGVAFGIRTVVLKSDGDALCEGAICQSERGVGLQERARASATVSTAAVGVGVAGLAVGLVLWATLPRATRTAFRAGGLTVFF